MGRSIEFIDFWWNVFFDCRCFSSITFRVSFCGQCGYFLKRFKLFPCLNGKEEDLANHK